MDAMYVYASMFNTLNTQTLGMEKIIINIKQTTIFTVFDCNLYKTAMEKLVAKSNF